MKQRFSSLDVKVIAHELSEALVTLRLSNIYDLSSKILLLKFAKPDNKKQLILDSGFRCHLTDFVRTTASVPSAFVARLRKFLKTRRVTSVRQIGTDRILELQFSDGQYRLFLEFFASGNVILTDADLRILALMRNVSEGEGQEPQRVGLTYSLENRQNVAGVPPLTEDRLRNALQSTIDKAAAATAAGKKIKKKAGDELRRGLVVSMTELPPVLIEHAFASTGFDATAKPAEVLESQDLFGALFKALQEARRIVDGVTSSSTCKGYIIAKKRAGNDAPQPAEGASEAKPVGLLYEDFHPFSPYQFEKDERYTILTFDNFNKTVDEFFSSLEGQRLESKLTEREVAAKRKLEAAKQDQAKRIEGLQEAQTLNQRKAAAIEANVERVQEAIDAVAGLLQQGMDWVDIGKLVEREQKRHNPVAEIIKLPMRLAENTITLLLAEEEAGQEDEDDVAYETDSSSDSDDEGDAEAGRSKSREADKRLEIDIDLALSPWGNAREYHEQKRTAAVKAEKTLQQTAVALKNAEQKITQDLQKGLKQEKAVLQPIRRQMWFEKFLWFISTDGYLVLGGRDAQQNEMLYRRYLRKGDVYVHADLHGAATVIIKNNPRTPDAPIPPSTLSQAGNLAVCSSNAWDSKAGMGAWWVAADQVSKSAPTGEYLPAGSFMVRGRKNFLPPAQLLLGFGVMFKISEESKGRHVKHRLYDLGEGAPGAAAEETPGAKAGSRQQAEEQSGDEDGSESEEEQGHGGNASERANPLQTGGKDEEDAEGEEEEDEEVNGVGEKMAELDTSEPNTTAPEPEQPAQAEEPESENDEEEDGTPSKQQPTQTTETSRSGTPSASQKKAPPKRGQKGKAKKAAKYKDQDEEDRAVIEELIGASKGRQKAEAEAKAKAQREAEAEAARRRRREQHERQQKQAAEHEEVRRMMLEEGVEVLDDAELAQATPLDALVGTPLPGDEILEVIPYCAPWTAMAKCKYKAKMQPGAQKKGKAVKEVLDRWRLAAGRKAAVDESGRDSERMWPREVELIKALKAEEALNCVPVGKVRVMIAGGSTGGGGASKGGGQGKGGAGGRGGKGSKRR